MVEESSRDRDPGALDSIDRVLQRIDSHPSLPALGTSRMPALGPPTAVADEGHEVREPAADVVVTPAKIYVTLELHGASRETIEVLADYAQLTVHAVGRTAGSSTRISSSPIPSNPTRLRRRTGTVSST